MKVLIVAKTRRGGGACVGGITEDGRSVRLIAADAQTNARAGLEYEIGEVWEIDSVQARNIVPPHVENIIVLRGQRLRRSEKLRETVFRFMAPVSGGPERLFEGLAQATSSGGLYVAESTDLPHFSTMFWLPELPLKLDSEGKRIRYRYPTEDGGRTLTYVGFQEPIPEIPAGTLLRVSLAHKWRPKDRPDEELRCFVQLSGWFFEPGQEVPPSVSPGRPQPEHSKEPANVPSLQQARDILKRTFGFSEFLPLQAEAIGRVLQHQDTLVVMPTGGGKSLCYQLPALLFEGLTVVVSPLIALMHDQVRQLHELDVPAACLNHMVPIQEYTSIAEQVRRGRIKVLYLAPETLLRPETLLLLEQSKLACLAVDEGHCISEWGHDFRPEYRQLQEVRRRFPSAVCLVLTATATARVRKDICRLLAIPPEGEFVARFDRPNLFLTAQERGDCLAQILSFLQPRRSQSGIIYCGTRRQADELAASLAANGWPALPYHAGLEPDARRVNQNRFINDEAPLIVATIAFGMGINKSNVRFVVHAHLPKDLESYYQEIGRAGRDGLRADCLLLFSRADAVLHRHFIEEGAPSERPGRQARLNALMRFAEARECRRVPLLTYFGEKPGAPCGHCDNCLERPAAGETIDATLGARKFLSCVKATGQMFGPAHIIAVLRGSRAERVLSRKHDLLPEYGQGRDHSVEEWRDLAREFIRLHLVEQEVEFGGLRLTSNGRDVLDGSATVNVAIEHSPAIHLREISSGQHDPELFERLRVLRRKLAEEANLPPYIVFSDRALLEMATMHPQSAAQFLQINGVGETKLARYGEPFLAAIRQYCKEKRLAQDPKLLGIGSSPGVPPLSRRRFHDIGERFASGQGIDEISERYGILRETVVQHLYRFLTSGGELAPERLLAESRLTDSERTEVLQQFERLGMERLAPVYEALSGKVSYEELHLLRAYIVCNDRKRVQSV